VECKLLLDALLESLSLLQSQGVSLGNDGDDVDDIRKLLQDDNVDRLEGVTRWLDEEQAGVNSGILDVTLSLGCELLAQVSGVLILDVFDDGIPAAIVVHQIAVARSVDNVELQAHTVLLDVVGNGMDLGSGSNLLIGKHTTFRLHQVRSEDGVDERRFAQASLTYKYFVSILLF
jgi:hypothetical protein